MLIPLNYAKKTPVLNIYQVYILESVLNTFDEFFFQNGDGIPQKRLHN